MISDTLNLSLGQGIVLESDDLEHIASEKLYEPIVLPL